MTDCLFACKWTIGDQERTESQETSSCTYLGTGRSGLVRQSDDVGLLNSLSGRAHFIIIFFSFFSLSFPSPFFLHNCWANWDFRRSTGAIFSLFPKLSSSSSSFLSHIVQSRYRKTLVDRSTRTMLAAVWASRDTKNFIRSIFQPGTYYVLVRMSRMEEEEEEGVAESAWEIVEQSRS